MRSEAEVDKKEGIASLGPSRAPVTLSSRLHMHQEIHKGGGVMWRI